MTIGDNDELIDLLRKTPVILRGLVAGLDDAAAKARAGDDGWAVVEVVGHLVDAERRAIDRIATVEAPTLIIHGDADGIIPLPHARRLYDAAGEPKRMEVFDGADHIAMDMDRIFRLTVEFDAANRRR